MKLSSLQENLKNGLFAVSHVAGKNINLPILNNILLEIKEGHIKLVATDLEIGITSLIRGKAEKDGAFTVESKIITDYVSLLPNKKLEIEKKDNKIILKCDNYKTTIRGLPADEFPLIPSVDKKNYYKTKADDFKKALAQTTFAAATSDTRIELAGVLLIFNKEKITLAATDSYRLAEKEIKVLAENDEERKAIIPAKTLQEVARILAGAKTQELSDLTEEIQIYLSENQILFVIGNIEIVSRIIEGQYPDYKQIIPVKYDTSAAINRVELIRAVKAAAIFSKAGVNDINFDFPLGKNKIIISSASSQSGDNVTELDAAVSGHENAIVLNYRYVLDGLNNIDSENVRLELTNGNTPCALKAEDSGDYLYIIMPIKQ